MLAFNNKEVANTLPIEGSDGYISSNEYFCARCVIIELDVSNNPVFMQLYRSPNGSQGQAEWERELYLAPQHRTISRQGIFGIRFRVANPLNEPKARVTVEFIGEDESWPTLGQIVG